MMEWLKVLHCSLALTRKGHDATISNGPPVPAGVPHICTGLLMGNYQERRDDPLLCEFELSYGNAYLEAFPGNQAVFDHAFEVLQPEGVFVLDYVNGEQWGNLTGKGYQKTLVLLNGKTRTMESQYERDSGTYITTITLIGSGKQQTKVMYHSTKYDSLEQVLAFLKETGFAIGGMV